MATLPSERGPVRGRVDSAGRLVEADPELAALQEEAGSRIGARLAIPQIVAIVRLARTLGVPVQRPAVAAASDSDIDLNVRAVPKNGDVLLTIEGWNRRPAMGPRLSPLFGTTPENDPAEQADEWTADEQLRLVSMSKGLADKLGVEVSIAVGQPLTKLLKLEEDDNGEMPLLAALAARHSFAKQPARGRKPNAPALTLSGDVVHGPDGSFAGFEGIAASESGSAVSGPARATMPTIDPALDEALRSPIDRIIESADLIVERSDGPLRSDYAAYAADISAAARHLLSVIRSMSEEPSQARAAIDLAALAAEASVMLETNADDLRVSVELQHSGPLPARGDERGVIQILVNLIGNAIRHSPPGSTVHVNFDRDRRHASATVVDEGPGIDPADQQRIFERFERATTSEDGTGLGLAIARRLARSMGGDITVESAPDQGSRFTLSLPSA